MSRKLRRSDPFELGSQSFAKSGLPTDFTFRENLLAAAGDLQISDLVRAAWAEVSQNAVTHNFDLEPCRWRTLVRSARLAGLESYIVDQVGLFGLNINRYLLREIQKALREPAPWENLYKTIPASAPQTLRMQLRRSIRDCYHGMGSLLTSIEERIPDSPLIHLRHPSGNGK